jgi:hypothetical protein
MKPWANKRASRAPVDWLQIDMAPAAPAGEWCNGNTAVFGTVVLGSSPSSPANFQISLFMRFSSQDPGTPRKRPRTDHQIALMLRQV